MDVKVLHAKIGELALATPGRSARLPLILSWKILHESLSDTGREDSDHATEVELVAVQVAEVAAIKGPTRSGRTFVLGTEPQGVCMGSVDHRRGASCPGRSRFRCGRGGLTIEGFGDEEQGRLGQAETPGDLVAGIDDALVAERREHGIVEGRGTRQVVGAEGDLADHGRFPLDAMDLDGEPAA